MNKLKDILSPAQVASMADKQYPWIMAIMPELIEAGLAKKIGGSYCLHADAIKYIANRPETRGRCKQK